MYFTVYNSVSRRRGEKTEDRKFQNRGNAEDGIELCEASSTRLWKKDAWDASGDFLPETTLNKDSFDLPLWPHYK